MISIKMDDGTRFDTDTPLDMNESGWVVVQKGDKIIYLSAAHIVSITETTPGGEH